MTQFLDLDGLKTFAKAIKNKVWPSGKLEIFNYEKSTDSEWSKPECDIIFAFDQKNNPQKFEVYYLRKHN